MRVKHDQVPVDSFTEAGWYQVIILSLLGTVFFMSKKESKIMDMKERLQELAEAARKRIEESGSSERLE